MNPGKSLGIASMILGPVALLFLIALLPAMFLCFPLFIVFLLLSLGLGITAFVLGIVSKKRSRAVRMPSGKATSGIVTSVICLALWLLAAPLTLFITLMYLAPVPDYRSQYPELSSIATHTIPGAEGFIVGEVRFPPEVLILEEDRYGRILFSYSEWKEVSTYSLVICQRTDDTYAYYYPDYCFISAATNDFSERAITRLKRENDWNKAIDLSKCEKVAISDTKEEGPIEDAEVKRAFNSVFGNESSRWFRFISMDDYGRALYVGNDRWQGDSEDWRYVIILFQADGSFDERRGFMILLDNYEYQDELKLFKDKNGWNTPP